MKLTSYTNDALRALQQPTRAFMAVLDDLTRAAMVSNRQDPPARVALPNRSAR